MKTAYENSKKLADLIKGEDKYKNLEEKTRYKLFNRWRKIYNLECKEIDLFCYANCIDLMRGYRKGLNINSVHVMLK